MFRRREIAIFLNLLLLVSRANETFRKTDNFKRWASEKIIKTVKLDITGFSGGATPRNCLNFNSILAKVETLMSGGNKINSQVRLSKNY